MALPYRDVFCLYFTLLGCYEQFLEVPCTSGRDVHVVSWQQSSQCNKFTFGWSTEHVFSLYQCC